MKKILTEWREFLNEQDPADDLMTPAGYEGAGTASAEAVAAYEKCKAEGGGDECLDLIGTGAGAGAPAGPRDVTGGVVKITDKPKGREGAKYALSKCGERCSEKFPKGPLGPTGPGEFMDCLFACIGLK